MKLSWFRRSHDPAGRLLRAAGLNRKTIDDGSDSAVSQLVAFRSMRRDGGTAAGVLAVAEELLADEANYEVVVSFLESVQNLASHGLEEWLSAPEVESLLGPRCAVCWGTVADFWQAVAVWSAAELPPLEPSAEILSVQNEQLRLLLWPTSRTLPGGEKLGLAQAVRYERSGGDPIPGFSHIAVAMGSAGPA